MNLLLLLILLLNLLLILLKLITIGNRNEVLREKPRKLGVEKQLGVENANPKNPKSKTQNP